MDQAISRAGLKSRASAAQRERPAQDGAAEAIHHQGEIGPAVLAAPDRGHVGLPELVGLDDVEGSALRLGMRPRPPIRRFGKMPMSKALDDICHRFLHPG